MISVYLLLDYALFYNIPFYTYENVCVRKMCQDGL